MSTATVTHCSNCPVKHADHYDSCTIDRCGHHEAPDNQSTTGNTISIWSKEPPPQWCPLRRGPLTVELGDSE